MLPLPPTLSLDQLTGAPLGHRFGVFFFAAGVIPNPLDIRFQKVSGLATRVETSDINEGGQNLHSHRIPVRLAHDNLVLERGFVIGSALNLEFNAAMSLFKFLSSNVMVTLFSEQGIPISAWMFIKAYPVKWATADLDASADRILIDTLELAYSHMQAIRI
jgi:phage tail-like protein